LIAITRVVSQSKASKRAADSWRIKVAISDDPFWLQRGNCCMSICQIEACRGPYLNWYWRIEGSKELCSKNYVIGWTGVIFVHQTLIGMLERTMFMRK